eukprot:symbB.v1.2.005924.t1/scaffold314.1/size231647/3
MAGFMFLFLIRKDSDTSVTPASARVAAQKAAEQPELAALVVPERKPPPLDLKQLLKLQMSLGRSLQIACLACRQSHPNLAHMIRQTISQAFKLWQHALKMVQQYAQVAQKVTERVLPDLDLAVQEAQPDLGVGIARHSRTLDTTNDRGWQHHARAAQQERLLNEAPRLPRQEAISNGAEHTRQAMMDRLVAFTEQISKGTADEAKNQELVELLFMSPGMAAPSLEPPSAPSRFVTKSTSSEEGG